MLELYDRPIQRRRSPGKGLVSSVGNWILGSLLPAVAMMQATSLGNGRYLGGIIPSVRNGPSFWAIFFERIMSPICMIVGDVIANQTAQVRFIEGNHMIEKLTAAAPDPALGNSVLPGTRMACAFRFYATCFQPFDNLGPKFGVSIQDCVLKAMRI